MSGYAVRDSRAPDRRESMHGHINDAIRAAMSSGLDVYVHAETCPTENPIGGECPCRPALIPGRGRAAASPFRPVQK